MRQMSTPNVRMGPLQMGIIVLTLATAIIHWVMAFPHMGTMPMLFYLNGIGYIVLLIALYLPQLAGIRRIVRWVLTAFAALTVILWFVMAPMYSTIGFIDKAIEIVLILLLMLEDWQSPAGY